MELESHSNPLDSKLLDQRAPTKPKPSYIKLHSLHWRIRHILLYMGGGVLFIIGSVFYIPKDKDHTAGGILCKFISTYNDTCTYVLTVSCGHHVSHICILIICTYWHPITYITYCYHPITYCYIDFLGSAALFAGDAQEWWKNNRVGCAFDEKYR
jgi:hypothetical protein